MPDPKQKSVEVSSLFLNRYVPIWQQPGWMEADRWRRVVENQPIAAVCEMTLINDLQGTAWEVRAKNPKEEDKLAPDIEGYTEVLNPETAGGIGGFDNILAGMGGQDLLKLPIGGNFEVVRWPAGNGPYSRPHKKGHVYKIAYMDGATLIPTYDPEMPLMQRPPENAVDAILFRRNEIMRLVMQPRTEMRRWGYGMAPPERIYLAILSLYRGDTYYANMLLDTPEAGLLDLGDMSQEAATEWVHSFRELFTGIDPMKIGVLYEHTTPANYLNFGRPPTDMMFDKISIKYAQITHAGYGLTLTDTGLGDPQKTLAGSIRDERRSRRSGFGMVKEKYKRAIDTEILPDYLEFYWVENDEESRVQKGRAFLVETQALKTAKDAGFIRALEGQKQLQKDGFFDIELEEPEEQPPALALPPGPANPAASEEAQQVADKVPASEGGRGDITGQAQQKAEIGVGISAVPADTSHFDQLAAVMRQSFAGVTNRMDSRRLAKLIKAATRKLYPGVARSFADVADDDLPAWQEERLNVWFGDADAETVKAGGDILDELDDLLAGENWWRLDPEIIPRIVGVLRLAFGEGATKAAEEVQEFLYTEGLVDSPDLIGFNFDLKNPRTLARIEQDAARLVTRVDDGTRYYLKRILAAGVDEGLASPEIAAMIREGAGVDEILRQAGYSRQVMDTVRAEVGGMSEYRTGSIVNTEVNRAESLGRLGEWREMGLTRKAWRHTGIDDACSICRGNEALGLVELDYVFGDVFGGTETPPGHPGVCHCHLEFDEGELIDRSGSLRLWTGS